MSNDFEKNLEIHEKVCYTVKNIIERSLMKEKIRYIEQGKILSTHGVRGELKLEVWCDGFSDFSSLKNLYLSASGAECHKLVSVKGGGKYAVVKLSGVDTVEDAAKLKSRLVYADRSELNVPAGKFLICDLIGLPVIDADTGAVYGTLTDVMNCPASDVYVVQTPNGEAQVPDVPQFIKRLSDDGIFITPIKGMFE